MCAQPAPVVLLPGILQPAGARYAPLLQAIDRRPAWPKDLEVYAGPDVPAGYGVDTEVAGVLALADARGLDRFHVYGHSAGGSIALALAARAPDRVLSLALDEPATDFTDEDRELLDAQWDGDLADLPPPQRMQVFARSLVRPGVELPLPPAGPPPPGMESRPAGLAAFATAISDHRVDQAALARFPGPVYVSYGSLSNARWEAMAARLAARLPDVEVECFEGVHHLRTSHVAEPARVARALHRLWARAEDRAAV
ncbi:hypothetical protein GCM10027451_10900 [Geodermatophilus aquaeductus]|uniref:Pimeloyl-ACP methyl ester carboxylesterase n=1 Tax=Geodermatophilus aquaeductus TaxID=1564161 RepID=A0A521DQI9_9ACTN|nr:alpha/beta fold hydrolase [Geodermatophilus aquaeductus]SMO73973.1 Pimeloyl-ACP methyl ester carboxylesterase [Geodermatophilus aquaeductus]